MDRSPNIKKYINKLTKKLNYNLNFQTYKIPAYAKLNINYKAIIKILIHHKNWEENN